MAFLIFFIIEKLSIRHFYREHTIFGLTDFTIKFYYVVKKGVITKRPHKVADILK